MVIMGSDKPWSQVYCLFSQVGYPDAHDLLVGGSLVQAHLDTSPKSNLKLHGTISNFYFIPDYRRQYCRLPNILRNLLISADHRNLVDVQFILLNGQSKLTISNNKSQNMNDTAS